MAPPPARLIESNEDLVAVFHDAEKPRKAWRIGTEAEKFGVHGSGRPAVFEGEIAEVLARLAARHGWSPYREHPDRPVIALRRGWANITLEPGGQLELSGAPLDTIHQTELEFAGHLAEVHAVSKDLDLSWLGLGFRPLARQDELPWVPKLRYGVMREYLPTRGGRALDMMRRTATVQANLDYENVEDAFRKLRVGLRLQPLVGAMFANAPYLEGKGGIRSHRLAVWSDVDPDRTGLLPLLWEGEPDYARYVEWALDAPMFLVIRDGVPHPNTGQTFRAYLKDGHQGLQATFEDWETHLNTLFPEARLKKTLEMRGVDGQRHKYLPAVPALWKGLLYEPEALSKAESLAGTIHFDALEKARPTFATTGLQGSFQGRALGAWASDVLAIATEGLARLGNLNAKGEDESIYLEPLAALVAAGRCPADEVVEAVGDDPTQEALLRAASA